MKPDSRRMALGAFIRAHRERLRTTERPAARRRTPGLRREELADAAGISVTWLTWLEQGREVHASPAALARLSNALQLGAAERAALFSLAQRHDPYQTLGGASIAAPEMLALTDHLDLPAYVLDEGWNALRWNAAAAKLFTGWLDNAGAADRNLLRYVFLSDTARALIADWEERSTRIVAEFGADYHQCPDDAQLLALADELLQRSPDFALKWQGRDVQFREGGLREFLHAEMGPLRFQQTTLVTPAQPRVRLVVLSPYTGPTIDSGESLSTNRLPPT